MYTDLTKDPALYAAINNMWLAKSRETVLGMELVFVSNSMIVCSDRSTS